MKLDIFKIPKGKVDILKNMEKTNKFCQSCGYPMKKDKKGGGSEKDGLN